MGNILLEHLLPGVMQDGLNTNKNAIFGGDVSITGTLTVTGTTTIAGISLTNLTVTGNTLIGNATSDTLDITGNTTITGTAAGTMLDIVATATTTGIGLDLTGNTALTTGQLLTIASSATAIATTGRLFLSTHSGATGTSATLNEFTSAATDETIVLTVGASAALALGKVLNISAAAVTTGTALNISDNTAMTTGTLVNIVQNSADTGTRSVVFIKQDHASASGATALEVTQDGALAAIKVTSVATSTNFFKIATMNGVTLWMGNGNTGNAALSGTAGDILFNGGSNKPEYCTGTTNWTALV